jgi:hypothetical protein
MIWIARSAAMLVLLFGVAHVAVGHRVFLAPTERGVWFLSAGLLLIVIGLSNLAVAGRAAASRLAVATALFGNLSILLVGSLLIVATPDSMAAPQAIALLVLSLLLAAACAGQLLGRRARRPAP